jgi:hypothetical protein
MLSTQTSTCNCLILFCRCRCGFVSSAHTDILIILQGAELTISWLEETLIEINLIFDILFLFFYDNLSRCNGGLWIMLCSIFKVHPFGVYSFCGNLRSLHLIFQYLFLEHLSF